MYSCSLNHDYVSWNIVHYFWLACRLLARSLPAFKYQRTHTFPFLEKHPATNSCLLLFWTFSQKEYPQKWHQCFLKTTATLQRYQIIRLGFDWDASSAFNRTLRSDMHEQSLVSTSNILQTGTDNWPPSITESPILKAHHRGTLAAGCLKCDISHVCKPQCHASASSLQLSVPCEESRKEMYGVGRGQAGGVPGEEC